MAYEYFSSRTKHNRLNYHLHSKLKIGSTEQWPYQTDDMTACQTDDMTAPHIL